MAVQEGLMFIEFFAAVGLLLSLLRYGTYVRAMVRGTTRPHPLTWLGASIMTGVAGVVQFVSGGGPTVWITSVVTLFCFGIGCAAIFIGDRRITTSDWATFAISLLIIPIWIFTKEPTLAIILVIVVDALNYYPTIRKTFRNPWDENAVSWGISAFRWLCAAFAVEVISIDTMLYPLFVAVFESFFIGYMLFRRRVVPRNSNAVNENAT